MNNRSEQATDRDNQPEESTLGEMKAQPGAVSSVHSPVSVSNLTGTAATRIKLGFGPRYTPAVRGTDAREEYWAICDDLLADLRRLDGFIVDGVVVDEAAGVLAQVEHDLERLYDCPFGEGESLKSIAVAIQCQVNNAVWTVDHVSFLKDAITFLRARYLIDDQVADKIEKLLKEHGLDPFRGTRLGTRSS